MPFLWVKVLIFQGSTHHIGVGSLSYAIILRTAGYADTEIKQIVEKVLIV